MRSAIFLSVGASQTLQSKTTTSTFKNISLLKQFQSIKNKGTNRALSKVYPVILKSSAHNTYNTHEKVLFCFLFFKMAPGFPITISLDSSFHHLMYHISVQKANNKIVQLDLLGLFSLCGKYWQNNTSYWIKTERLNVKLFDLICWEWVCGLIFLLIYKSLSYIFIDH